MRPNRVLIIASLIVVAAIVATAYQALTVTTFQPAKITVDLSHADQRGALEGPWDLRPDKRFPGVMSARDHGQPVRVVMTIPQAGGYEGRFKIKFSHMDQRVEILMNKALITTVRPSRVEEAEKFDAWVPRTAIANRTNQVSFVNHGTPGAEYELVQLKNYRSVLVKKHLYLLSRDRQEEWVKRPPGMVTSWLGLWAAFGALFGVIVIGGGWAIARLTGRGWRTTAITEFWACAPVLLVGLLLLVPWVTPFRIVCTPGFFWKLTGGILATGQLVVIGTALLAVLGRWLGALDFSAGAQGVRSVVQGVGQRQADVRRSVSQLVLQVPRQIARRGPAVARGIGVVIRWGLRISWGGVWWCGRRAWRWFLRYQYPRGYGLLFCYLGGLALVSHWVFHWEQLAEVIGYLAGAALVIAIAWESVVSLKEEE